MWLPAVNSAVTMGIGTKSELDHRRQVATGHSLRHASPRRAIRLLRLLEPPVISASRWPLTPDVSCRPGSICGQHRRRGGLSRSPHSHGRTNHGGGTDRHIRSRVGLPLRLHAMPSRPPRLRAELPRRLLSKWCGSWRWGGVGAAGWPVGPVGLGRAAPRGRLRG